MLPRIAIPLPHSGDSEYAERALHQYVHAVEMAGGEAVRIPLDLSQAEVLKLIEACDGVLLPGSKADVDPAKITIGSPTGAPLVLAPMNDLLGLAITEGIEDAISVHQETGLGS